MIAQRVYILPIRTLFLLAGATLCAFGAQPDTLRLSLPAPPVGVQVQARLGSSVAVDGGLAVLGAPSDKVGGFNVGTVKIFDCSTGHLLYVIPKPNPFIGDAFGDSVGISGTRVVVGAPDDANGEFTNAGSVFVYDLSSPTPTVPVFTLPNPGAQTEGGNFGDAVAISGNRIVVGVPGDGTTARAAGRVYVYDLSSLIPTQPIVTLDNPSPTVDDAFGSAVAISGARIVVGTPENDQGASNAGSVYIYDLEGATPSAPVAALINPGPASSDFFGRSVSVSGNRVVVGADGDDIGAGNAGSAYIYDLTSPAPTVPVLTLNNPAPFSGDNFGNAVSISCAWVAVSAWQDDTDNSNKGTVYVYDLGSTTPGDPKFVLNNPNPTGFFFGNAVAVAGNIVIVGEDTDDAGADSAGSAFVYNLSGAAPTSPVVKLQHVSPSTEDLFGCSVAMSGRYMVVGAYQESTAAKEAGSAYVYDLTSVTPGVPLISLNNPDPAAGDWFGFSVSISGSRILVGAPHDDAGAKDAGSAYVYDLKSANPSMPLHVLNNPAPAASDQFGFSVAISGTRLVVGANQDDTGGTDAGTAYVYDLGSATPLIPAVSLVNSGAFASGDRLGTAVAIDGSLVALGAPSGAFANAYDIASASPTAVLARLSFQNARSSDVFGASIAISGSRVVVGAPLSGDGGAAYVYDLGSATPSAPSLVLSKPNPENSDGFGRSVSISGSRIVVGADRDSSPSLLIRSGGAYLYDLSTATPGTYVAKLSNPLPTQSDAFGGSVSIDGLIVGIGVPQEDSIAYDKGFAYVFAPAGSDADDDGLLDLWEYAHFGTIEGHSALDDRDGDGRSELLELAFDGNPMESDPWKAPAVEKEGGFLTMTLSKRAGVTYVVESAGEADGAAFSVTNTTILQDSVMMLKVRDNVPIDSASERFLRVRVYASP